LSNASNEALVQKRRHMGALFKSDGAPRPYVQKPTNRNLLNKLDVKMNNPIPLMPK
jgi:hypothetical protein